MGVAKSQKTGPGDQGADQERVDPAELRPGGPVKFKPGQSGNPHGRKGKPKPEEPDGLTDAQRMRAVQLQPESADKNSAQRKLRKVYDADPLAFIKLAVQLEKAERDAARQERDAAREESAEGPTGHEKVEELIAELLAESGRRGGGTPSPSGSGGGAGGGSGG